MKTEKGVVAVVYKQVNGSCRFLVLNRKKNWEGWELLKGNLEKEGYEETVKLELEEESGIEQDEVLDIQEMDETVSWEYERDGEKRQKQYRAFLVEVGQEATVDVTGNPHDEHEQGFFLSFTDAEALLTYEDQVELLGSARERID